MEDTEIFENGHNGAEPIEADGGQGSHVYLSAGTDTYDVDSPCENVTEADDTATPIAVREADVTEGTDVSDVDLPRENVTEAEEPAPIAFPEGDVTEGTDTLDVDLPRENVTETEDTASMAVPEGDVTEGTDASDVDSPCENAGGEITVQLDPNNMKHRARLNSRLKAKREEENESKSKVSPLREILEWILYIAVFIALSLLFIQYVGQRTRVQGESMINALQDGDNLIVDKISYRFRDPERYDIIVFPYKYREKTYYIKRIIGLPGETVLIRDGTVYINGEPLDEDYGAEPIAIGNEGTAREELTLGDDEYFVLGDNRNHSADSRDPNVGLIKRGDIVGRAWVRIWPLKSMGFIKHK